MTPVKYKMCTELSKMLYKISRHRKKEIPSLSYSLKILCTYL